MSLLTMGRFTIIIHNAPFDIGFLKKEFSLIDDEKSFLKNEIIDSLKLARKNSPGRKYIGCIMREILDR